MALVYGLYKAGQKAVSSYKEKHPKQPKNGGGDFANPPNPQAPGSRQDYNGRTNNDQYYAQGAPQDAAYMNGPPRDGPPPQYMDRRGRSNSVSSLEENDSTGDVRTDKNRAHRNQYPPQQQYQQQQQQQQYPPQQQYQQYPQQQYQQQPPQQQGRTGQPRY